MQVWTWQLTALYCVYYIVAIAIFSLPYSIILAIVVKVFSNSGQLSPLRIYLHALCGGLIGMVVGLGILTLDNTAVVKYLNYILSIPVFTAVVASIFAMMKEINASMEN